MADTDGLSFDTPTIQADSAILTLHSETRIAAPAPLVFRILRNTETWKDWNKFSPKVNITYQPPDDDDFATTAEIAELVRNTSIAGSYDSDLTDGMQGGGSFKQRLSENGERPNTPPLRLRMNSQASRGSQRSGSEDLSASGSVGAASPPTMNTSLFSPAYGGTAGTEDPHAGMSSVQKYAAVQAERKASVASGKSVPVAQNTLKESSPPVVYPLGPRKSLVPPDTALQPRRHSKTPSLQKEMRQRQASLNLLYGEPPVRLQVNTRMNIWMRMNFGNTWDYKQMHCVVTEVSRPDIPTDGTNLTQLTRSTTHTLNRRSVYRLVWALDNTMSSVANIKNGSAYPKSLLVAERVHEIRPITLGDGSEECELRVWELQKGTIAKMTKKKSETYLQEQMVKSGIGLRDFCESLVGKVDRRDFLVVEEEDIRPVTFTFS